MPAGSHPHCPQCAVPSLGMHPLPSVTGWLGLWKLSAAYRELSWPSPPTPGEKSFHMSCFFLCWARKPPGRARSATRLGSRLACRRARPRDQNIPSCPCPFPFGIILPSIAILFLPPRNCVLFLSLLLCVVLVHHSLSLILTVIHFDSIQTRAPDPASTR